jgi:hypothetical protein
MRDFLGYKCRECHFHRTKPLPIDGGAWWADSTNCPNGHGWMAHEWGPEEEHPNDAPNDLDRDLAHEMGEDEFESWIFRGDTYDDSN